MAQRGRVFGVALAGLALWATALWLTDSALASEGGGVPFTAERMWGLDRLGEPAISPDGKLAVVPVTRYDVGQNKGLTDLWLIPTAGGDARRLTSDDAP